MLEPGTQVAGYRIEGVLGHGGMGIVYSARQIALERLVALKILAPQLSADESFRQRFRREGQVQAAIDHPHIIPIYEAGEIDGALFITMRLVRGPTLKDLIVARQLEAARTLRILKPIAQALDAAHEVELIHRDIKPQNILVGLHDHPYLADFGLTKGANEVGLTRTGQFVGTTDYVAPEQIRGENAGAPSDVYALAGVLYECLTGVVPYAKPSDAAVLFAHMMEAPPLVTDQRPDLPAALDEVVARGMAKDPSTRQPCASDLIAEAERAFGRRIRAAITPPGPLEVPEETGIRFPEQKIATHETHVRAVPEPPEQPPPSTGQEQSSTVVDPKPPEPVIRPAEALPAAADASNVLAFPPPQETAFPAEPERAEPAPEAPRLTAPAAPTPLAPTEHAPTPPAPTERAPVPPPLAPTEGAPAPSPLAPRRTREETPATLRDASAPVPAAGSAGAPARGERRSLVPAALVVAAVAGIAVAAGLLLGKPDDSTPPPAPSAPSLSSSAANDAVALSFPATWSRADRAPAIDGLDLARPVAVTAGARGAGVVAGRTTATGPTLLPAAFVRQLPGRPAAERVRLGELQALRYRDLRPNGSATALTVFAVPTTRGVATVACHTPAAAAAAFRADCERVAASLKLSGAKPYGLGPQEPYARGVDRALTALAAARGRDRRALASARTQGGQAKLAGALARDHDRAGTALARLAVSPADARAHAALVAAVRRSRDGYARMARAARRHDAKGFAAGERAVRDGDERLRTALAALKDLGYRTG
jgi:serine/threonine protein kinase